MSDQPYLEVLYKAILSLGYYGLFQIGELVSLEPHTIKAANIHVAKNKNKILVILFSSKTQTEDSYPQKVKITAQQPARRQKFFCLFNLIKQYLRICGGYSNENEPFYIFTDKSPVMDITYAKLFKKLLKT